MHFIIEQALARKTGTVVDLNKTFRGIGGFAVLDGLNQKRLYTFGHIFVKIHVTHIR
jgi:hypothetical protein